MLSYKESDENKVQKNILLDRDGFDELEEAENWQLTTMGSWVFTDVKST